MNRYMLGLLLACLWAQCENPSNWMQRLNVRVHDAISSAQSKSVKAQRVEDIFKPFLAVDLFTKKIIGRQQWLEASPSERALVQRQLYHVMLSDYSDAVVQTLAAMPKVHRVRYSGEDVASVVVMYRTNRDKNLLANFSLTCVGNAWNIDDVAVQGVRLTDLQQAKYKKILANGGVPALSRYLQDHMQRPAAEPLSGMPR